MEANYEDERPPDFIRNESERGSSIQIDLLLYFSRLITPILKGERTARKTPHKHEVDCPLRCRIEHFCRVREPVYLKNTACWNEELMAKFLQITYDKYEVPTDDCADYPKDADMTKYRKDLQSTVVIFGWKNTIKAMIAYAKRNKPRFV